LGGKGSRGKRRDLPALSKKCNETAEGETVRRREIKNWRLEKRKKEGGWGDKKEV